MLISDEESVVSPKGSDGPGEDIFGKYDPVKLVADGSIDYSTDEDEYDEEEDEEEEDEEDIHRKNKKHKIRLRMSW